MFSSNGKTHIQISGGTSWTQVPINSNYPGQEIGKDGNKYAPVSEVNKPVNNFSNLTSLPINFSQTLQNYSMPNVSMPNITIPTMPNINLPKAPSLTPLPDTINNLLNKWKSPESKISANALLYSIFYPERNAKSAISKQKEEHNRRMQQNPEYAENYKIKEAENEICKLAKEIAEQKKIDPFAGQQLNDAVIGRKKAFEYSKNLGCEGAKAYLKELQHPENERFFDARVGASVAVQIFDKIIPLQNKIEQEKTKIQEIENIRTKRILKEKEEYEHEKSKRFKEKQKEEQFQKIEFPFEEMLKETYIAQKVSDEEVIEGSPALTGPPTKEEDPSWWKMAKRAFNGDRSQEVLDWQKENRDKMRYVAAVFDGINEGAELFDEPLKKYKTEVLGTIKEGKENIEDALESGELCETQQLIHRIKKIAYETTEKIADNVLPESMSDVGVMIGTLGVGTGVTKVVAKEAKKMLFSYKLYRKAEAQAKALTKNGPTDIIQHEAIKTQYRQNMKEPIAKDVKLAKTVKKMYREKAKLGSGSTADAVRYEIITGKPVEGKFHIEKAMDFKRSLEKWLQKNPTSDPGDRAIAENLILDLKDALGEKPWYSQTKPPKY
jgi:hypothetical protein